MSNRDDREFQKSATTDSPHVALRRLLLKLELINQKLFDRFSTDADRAPLSYYSSLGCFDEKLAIERVSQELRIEVWNFHSSRGVNAQPILLSAEPFSQVDISVWRDRRAVPVGVSDEQVVICMADPLDTEFTQSLEFQLQRRVKVVLSAEKSILDALSLSSDEKGEIDFNELFQSGLSLKNSAQQSDTRSLESNITSDDVATPTVIKLVNRIFAASIQQGASDIHITPEASQLAVRIRVDGILRDCIQIPLALTSPVIARIKILCGMDTIEKRLPQDARLRLKTNSGQRDLRISTVPTAYAEDIVIRVLSSELGNLSLETLGMPGDVKSTFCAMLRTSSKIHLVTGPTGSGKTSTLYAGLLYLHDGKSRIITIEDPIEYRIQGVSQIQVNAKIEMTFSKALRSVLRQDPDIVLVGEIRDSETAITATQVAQTGHLVLSTLHTNNAIAAITRLRDLGIKSFLISSSLGSVLAQRLVRRNCPNCQTEVSSDQKDRATALGLNPATLKQSTGCEVCSNTGYLGRIGVFSFLEVTPQIAQAIHSDASEDRIEELAREEGYQSLEEAGLQLVESGMTTFEELERAVGPLHRMKQARRANASGEAAATVETAPGTLSAHSRSDGALRITADGSIQKRKLLLVDDDNDVRSLYAHILELQMFDVSQAVDGVSALDQVYQSRPDVIVLDVRMPRLSGPELVERLRADPQTRGIPVLMLTANAEEELELDLMKKGADDFVSKTSRTEVIVARINRLVNRTAA